MEVSVFDDKKSLAHFFLGSLAAALQEWKYVIFIIFLFYELIEFMLKSPKEKAEHFVGDLMEFSFGTAFITLLWK